MFEDFATAVDQAARGDVPVAAKPPSAFRLLLDTIRDRRRRARENRRRRRSEK